MYFMGRSKIRILSLHGMCDPNSPPNHRQTSQFHSFFLEQIGRQSRVESNEWEVHFGFGISLSWESWGANPRVPAFGFYSK